MLVLAGLFVTSGALATIFTNGTQYDLWVEGRVKWYPVGAENRAPSKLVLSNTRTFETGMVNNLGIKVGEIINYKNFKPALGVPYPLRFNLGPIQKHFASVKEVIFTRENVIERGRIVGSRFVLSMYGKPKMNGLAGAKKYCESGNCSVDRTSTDSWLIVKDILK